MAKFEKGMSGNPGGRPKAQGEIREIARKHTDAAINTLVKVMDDPDATSTARVGAATALLDRAWGRPAQTINANLDSAPSIADTLPDMSELLAKFIKRSEQAGSSDYKITTPKAAA